MLVCAATAALFSMSIHAASADGMARTAIDCTQPALAIGMVACFASSSDPAKGANRATKAADSVLTSVALARLIKHSTNFDSGTDERHRFPSGHSAAAFAMARHLSKIHPKNKWLYYAGATMVGFSTVKLGTHSWADVAGGAVLGITVSNMSISSHNGLLISRVFKF